MKICTWDKKEKATYDLRRLSEYFTSSLEVAEGRRREAIIKADAYYNGYQDALCDIKNIMQVSNYRAEDDDND